MTLPDESEHRVVSSGTQREPGAERRRLAEARDGDAPWRLWGPYLSERQWGTVREDYSDDGDAWSYFSHDQARSRAYRSGEDGIAGYSDERQILCFALALWNGRDPILKERLFGLTNGEGNHGEDVKEYYHYLDATPTNSYLRFAYRYPQAPFPYDDLVATNASRSRTDPEYELLDTGVFDDDRYFDVEVEYAKASPSDTAIRITVTNRGPEPAAIHLLPTLWFRNTWSWGGDEPRPAMRGTEVGATRVIAASHPELGEYWLMCDGADALLFTENETNSERLGGPPEPHAVRQGWDQDDYVTDGGSERGQQRAGRDQGGGPLPARASSREHRCRISLRLERMRAHRTDRPPAMSTTVIDLRRAEADAVLRDRHPAIAERGSRRASCVRRLPECSGRSRPTNTTCMAGLATTAPIPRVAMPPSAATCIGITCSTPTSSRCRTSGSTPGSRPGTSPSMSSHCPLVDEDFAKDQLELMLRSEYLHPNGQLPAYDGTSAT